MATFQDGIAELETQRALKSFPLKVLRFLLWVTIITGVVSAVLAPFLAYRWPDSRLGLNVPVAISATERVAGANANATSSNILDTVPFEVTAGQYNLTPTQIPRFEYWMGVLGGSILALAVSYGAWLLLSIVRSLPRPFTNSNADTLIRLGWLGVAVNIANDLLGFYLTARLNDEIKTGALAFPLKITDEATFTLSSAGLSDSFFIPWPLVFGAFALALIFRIGVRHRESEQRLAQEQELTV